MTPDVIEQVAFVSGVVLHGGTGRPLSGSVVITADRGPMAMKYLDDGTFALSGRREVVFPDLATTPYTLQLKVVAKSPEWRTGGLELALAPVAVPAGHDFAAPAGLLTVAPSPATAPPATVLLPADPVSIRGRVTRSGAVIVGATVTILPSGGPAIPPVLTNANGDYAFPGLIIPPGSSISCTFGATVVNRLLLIDYTLSEVREDFRLPA